MRGNNPPLSVPTVLSLLALVGLALFAHGFFLTRVELAHKTARCDATSCFQAADVPPPFKKMVLVIIDALRIDFVAPDELAHVHDARHSKVYLDKLASLRHLRQSHPQQCFVARFLADPPTTTMQRLKGMLTGGLPTFIDIKDDVNSEAIEEDSLIFQLVRLGRRIVFMGDDTWTNLFPNAFVRAFPYPSFNVKDIDGVDNGVLEHLAPELEKDDWDVLVAHFLGVDHVGHRYGPRHPEMARKLTQLDVVIRQLSETLAQRHSDTLLVILGDHGMTEDGNHGGSMEEEVSSALFVFSPVPLHGLVSSSLGAVDQIDLVPTLAMLLGAPIPFGNLGALIPGFFNHSWPPFHSAADALVHASAVNARQIVAYLDAYAQRVKGSVSDAALAGLRANLELALREPTAQARVEALRRICKDASTMARELWTQFNLPVMALGAILVVASSAMLVWQFVARDVSPGVALALVLNVLALTSNSFIEAEHIVAVFCFATGVVLSRKRALAWPALVASRLAIELAPVFRAAGHEGKEDFATLASSLLLVGLAAAWLESAAAVAQAVAVAAFWLAPGLTGKAWGPRAVLLSGAVAGALGRDAWVAVPLMLLLGPASPWAAALAVALTRSLHAAERSDADFGVLVGLAVSVFFFATGHSNVFGSLRITAPYVGFEEFGYYRGVVMLALDSFCAHLVGAWVATTRGPQSTGALLAMYAARAAVTTVFVAAQRRHLMVWRVFAPKFVFDASGLAAVVVFSAALAGAKRLRRARAQSA